jgi:hypothetical protein
VPAYWWTHNLYALMRNEAKFLARDHRVEKTLLLEFSPFAPDTAEECIEALGLLEEWVGRALGRAEGIDTASEDRATRRERGRGALSDPRCAIPNEVEAEGLENSKRASVVVKPARAWKAYREILLWYALSVLAQGEPEHFGKLAGRLGRGERESSWDNLGGQLAPSSRISLLLAEAREGKLPTWTEMHAGYARLAADYPADKARHAWAVLAWLEGKAPEELAATDLAEATQDFVKLTFRIEEEVFRSRKKDHDNRYRRATFRSAAEMEAVVGRPEKNSFVLKTKRDMAALREKAAAFLTAL